MEEESLTSYKFPIKTENCDEADNVYFYVPLETAQGANIVHTIKEEVIEELPVVEEVEIDAEGNEEIRGEYTELREEILSPALDKHKSKALKKEVKVILLQRIPVENEGDQEVFPCSICNNFFYSQEELLKHQQCHKHLCYVCGKSFEKLKNFQRHTQMCCKNPFGCSKCSLSFKNSNALKIHVYTTHIARRSLECPFCYRRFSKRDILKGHIVCHIGGEPFKCSYCVKSFNGAWLLKHHLKEEHIESTKSDLKCCDCNQYFSSEKILIDHIKYHSVVRSNLCHICGKVLGSEIILAKHMALHFNNKKWSCGVCQKRYFKESKLRNHMRKHSVLRPFRCTICGVRFANEANLKRHTQIHIKVKRHQCKNCDKVFNQKQSLNYHVKKCNYVFSLELQQCAVCATFVSEMDCSLVEHLRRHEKDHHTKKGKKPPILCPICSRPVHSKEYLKLHLNSHSGIKPFSCEKCDRCFSTPSNLLRHKEIHSEVKQFLCSMCGRRFSQKQTLSAHIRSHLGIKRYQCQICERRFSESRSLKRHLARHDAPTKEPENIFQCTGCEQKFYSEETVLEHIQICQESGDNYEI